MIPPRLCLLAALCAAAPAAFAQTSETGGIGGTGVSHETGGIGGTGIARPILGIGPIQAFGSVFVNGREYAYDAATRITVDGLPAAPAALQVGDVAQVLGQATGARGGYAREIAVVHALIGPVSRVSADGRSAVILGQTVQASGGALFAQVTPGQTLAVSAQQDAGGVWHAGAISPAAGGHFQIVAQLTAVQPGQLSAAGLAIAAPAALTAQVQAGMPVLVSGKVVKDGLVAASVAPAPGLAAPAGTLVEAQDYFRSVGEDRAEAPDGLTAAGAAPPLSGDSPVEIVGTVEAPGVLEINDVDLDVPSPADEVEPAREGPEAEPEIPELPDNELLEHGKPDD